MKSETMRPPTRRSRASTISRLTLEVLRYVAQAKGLDSYIQERLLQTRTGLTVRRIVDLAPEFRSRLVGFDGTIEVTVGRVACALANAEARGEVFVDRSRRPYRYAWLFEWERRGTRSTMVKGEGSER